MAGGSVEQHVERLLRVVLALLDRRDDDLLGNRLADDVLNRLQT